MLEREVAPERPAELSRRVIARPDSVLVHAYRHGVAREAHFQPRPAPPQRVMDDLPWTYAPDYREHQRTAGLQQSGTCARHIRQIGYAIQRTQIGVRAVKTAFTLEALKLMRADSHCLDAIGHRLLTRAFGGTGNHLRRPVRGGYSVSEPGHTNGVQARAASKIDHSAASREGPIQPTPHLIAHVLDQRIVAARTIVIGGNAVERVLCVAQVHSWINLGHVEAFRPRRAPIRGSALPGSVPFGSK